MQRHGGYIDLRDFINAQRGGSADVRHIGRIIREAAAVEDVIGSEGQHLAAGPIDADRGAYLERVPLDAALELLVAVVREPHRAAGKKHCRQRDIEWEGRVIAAAKAAADISELGIDGRWLEGLPCFTQQEPNRGGGLVWRLHPEHELQDLAVQVVPGKTAFRLEEHRVDRLGLEFPVEHEYGGIVLGQEPSDLLAIDGTFRIGCPFIGRDGPPDRASGVVEPARADPPFLDRGVDVQRVGRGAGDAGEPVSAVIGHD